MIRLIIAPHVDDDVIGCGGLLAAKGKECVVAYLGVDDMHVVDRTKRLEEANAVAGVAQHLFLWPVPAKEDMAFIGRNGRSIAYHASRRVNNYEVDFASIVRDLEWMIGRWQPDEIYLPWPSYNQDHQAVYRAAMVALRPSDYVPFVNRVFLYEEPDCFWPGAGEAFKPTFFRSIDGTGKLKLYELMASQVRAHRSLEHLTALMHVRGAAIMVPCAEAYHVLRMCE